MKKSQAAMEFLMTWGWGVLVIAGAIAALSYFGVLTPDRFLPNKCTLPTGLACLDHNVRIDSVTVVVKNSMGYNIDDNVNATLSNGNCQNNPDISLKQITGWATIGTNDWRNSQEAQFIFTCNGLTPKSRFESNLMINYVNTNSKLPHSAQGEIRGKVE